MARAFVLALFACVVLLCVSSPGVGAERVLADINATYISQVFDTQVGKIASNIYFFVPSSASYIYTHI
jgi:hypothetical protein